MYQYLLVLAGATDSFWWIDRMKYSSYTYSIDFSTLQSNEMTSGG